MIISTQQPIAFPCLHPSGCILVLAKKKSFVKYRLKKYIGDNHYILKYGVLENFHIPWILDRNGCLREIKYVKVYRRWAILFNWLHDFTLAKCEILPGRNITVGQLFEKVRMIKSPREFQAANSLRRYLRHQQPNRFFDAAMFREFWTKYGPSLTAEQWLEQYPEM